MSTETDGKVHRRSGNLKEVHSETRLEKRISVVDALDIDVAADEMVSIIGPSGSGKATVLRMLMTVEEIDEGVFYVDGEPLTHMPEGDRLYPVSQRHLRSMRLDTGIGFQQFKLLPTWRRWRTVSRH